MHQPEEPSGDSRELCPPCDLWPARNVAGQGWTEDDQPPPEARPCDREGSVDNMMEMRSHKSKVNVII